MNRLDEFKEVIKRRERKKKTVFIFSMTLALTLGLYLFFASPFANTSQVFISKKFKISPHGKSVSNPEKKLLLLDDSEYTPLDSVSENIDSIDSSISVTEIELKLFPYQGNNEEKKDSEPSQDEEVDTIQSNPPVLEEIENDTSQKPLDSSERMPSFIGGNYELDSFLKKQLQYPPEALEQKVEGEVIVRFVIDDKGALQDFSVVEGLGFGCDEEALRIAKSMPPWIPGEEEGTPVSVIYSLPINFEIN